jgi:hypothetical protein
VRYAKNLSITFWMIMLIDANGIHPKKPYPLFVSEMSKRGAEV